MKKISLIVAGVLLSVLTVTVVNAESTRNPNITLENKYKVIDQMVIDGELDKTKAEEIKKEMENCDGTKKQIGKKYNLQFGKRLGNVQGRE